MTTKTDWSSVINRLTGWLVGLLAVIAFVLSYNALRHVAVDYGVPELLSYAWPLLVDFALIVFSMAVLRASLLGERTWWPWTLTGLFTLTTVGFNLIHAPDNRISQVVAVVAPIALFLSFETLMGMVKNGVKFSRAIQSLARLETALAERQAEVDAALGELTETCNRRNDELQVGVQEVEGRLAQRQAVLDALEEQVEQARTRLAELNAQIEQAQMKAAPQVERRRQLLSILASEGDIGPTAMAERVGASRNTVYADLSALEETGTIYKNGAGWKVKA